MTSEGSFLLGPIPNYQSIDRPYLKNKRRKPLCAAELQSYIDDPRWVLFRIVIVVLLIITFTTLLLLAIWICYNEYIYNCSNNTISAAADLVNCGDPVKRSVAADDPGKSESPEKVNATLLNLLFGLRKELRSS